MTDKPKTPTPDLVTRRVEALARWADESALRLAIAHDLDAIVVATVGCWSPETRAGVLRTLLEERIVEWQGVAGGMLGMGHGNWEPYRDAIEFAQFILKFDAALLSPLPADAREDTHDGK